MHEKLKSALTIIIFTVLTISLVEVYLKWTKSSATSSEKMDEGFLLHDKELGWKLRPNWQGNHSHKDFNVSYKINSHGFRKHKNESSTIENIAIIGDSFTFGIGVNEEHTFVSQLNKQMKQEQKTTQFKNYGVPGYSTDQEYLLAKKLSRNKLITDAIIVVYLGNDLIDNQYPFPIQANYGKPYFKNKNEQLTLKNTPVPLQQKALPYSKKTLATEVLGDFEQSPLSNLLTNFELGQRINAIMGSNKSGLESHFKKHLKPSIELFSSLIEVSDRAISKQKGKLTIALLPSQAFVVSNSSIPARYQQFLKENIVQHFKNTNIQVIDLSLALKEHFETNRDALFHQNEGHLNTQGHAVVTETMIKALKL